MKIVEMRVTPIAFADPPLLNAAGLHAPYALRLVIELVSEDGIIGLGETHGGEAPLRDCERVRPAVIGRDAFDLEQLWQDIARELAPEAIAEAGEQVVAAPQQAADVPGGPNLRAAQRVYGAIEVAALDLIGKSIGRPVYDLLGGKVRDTVPFSAYLFYKYAGGGGAGDDAREDVYGEALTPDGIVAQAKAFIDGYGFGSIKLKGGVFPPEQEIEAMLAMRDAFGPDVPLRLDPNGNWSVETAIGVGKALAGALEYLEDPVATLPQMAQVRAGLLAAGIDMPLGNNTSVVCFADVPEAVLTDATQVILGDHHYWGGPRAVKELGRICQTFGLGLSMHSNSHLGISLMAMAHLAAATPHLTYASDTHYPWQDPADEIVEEGRTTFVDGAVTVPDEPGLGVTLDQDALARGRERYERSGLTKRDDAIEMRKHVDPAWERIVPRW